jgi:heat shock protein HtpX
MPLTFIDIERQKNWRIAVLFLFLLTVYAAVIAAFALPLLNGARPPARFWFFSFTLAVVVAGLHFWFSSRDAVASVVSDLNAGPPDRNDDIHKVFANIIQEVHVVTGNRRTIEGYVIPSLSLNALAVADLRGRAAIGITEGLLSRLTRPQVEAVVAHEAHHILSGDCLETTVAASLFGTLSSFIEKTGRISRGRSYFAVGFLLAWLLLKLSHLVNMFISRERESRADAASVRMTRNPVALAEALHLLSRSWRGSGFIGSGLEMLCIVNPEASALDEREGPMADLFSTHPPVRKRIEVLLRMARVSIAELDARRERRQVPAAEEPSFYAQSPAQAWEGPFTTAELVTLPWLSPLTWVTTGDSQPVDRAWKTPAINAIFSTRLLQDGPRASALVCPVCRQPLVATPYEGTEVHQCRFCTGTLVENVKVPRILARTIRPLYPRVSALARTAVKENQARYIQRKTSGSKASLPLLPCPKCGNPMHRMFYSMALLIEVDRCGTCGVTWFDKDELDMVQCLVEQGTAAHAPGSASTS